MEKRVVEKRRHRYGEWGKKLKLFEQVSSRRGPTSPERERGKEEEEEGEKEAGGRGGASYIRHEGGGRAPTRDCELGKSRPGRKRKEKKATRGHNMHVHRKEEEKEEEEEKKKRKRGWKRREEE